MRKWVVVLLIALAAIVSVQAPVGYVHACDPNCPAPPK
jgi:hypothetical protein